MRLVMSPLLPSRSLAALLLISIPTLSLAWAGLGEAALAALAALVGMAIAGLFQSQFHSHAFDEAAPAAEMEAADPASPAARPLGGLNLNLSIAHLLAGLLEHIDEGILVTDAEGTIRLANRAFQARSGFTHDELVGANASILRSGRHDDAFYRGMWHALKTSGRWHGLVWNRRRDGERCAEDVTITVITDANGRIGHYLAIYRDPPRNPAAWNPETAAPHNPEDNHARQ